MLSCSVDAQVIPNGQSLIADYNEELDRGKAFGWLYLTGAVGAMLGTLYSTNVGAWSSALAVGTVVTPPGP